MKACGGLNIVSWNVNGLRSAVRNGFVGWLERAQPDVLCLQEVRAKPGDLPPEVCEPAGYVALWQPAVKPGYAGTAVFTKQKPVSASPLGIEEFDREGRVQVVEFEDLTLVNAYFPNSQPERARIDYKLAFCEAITACCSGLCKQGKRVLLCGDYNIAHRKIDLARPDENQESPGFLPEERAAMDAFLGAGYVDTFRHFTKAPGHYTWWSYRTRARERNIGWRLDYHCASEGLMPRVRESVILSEVMGSDHCPVAIVIANG